MDKMDKKNFKKIINTAAGRIPADLVLKNGKIVDVYNGQIIEGDVAVCGQWITGVGTSYQGIEEIDVQGKYISPGLIDSHVHIESSYVTPEEFGRLVIPHGTTTIVADAHEIANVCGIKGLNYMIAAGQNTPLNIQWMLPSCVPAAPFEHTGAVIDADAMAQPLASGNFSGLGEFMNFPGVIHADSDVLDKLLAAQKYDIPVDGHSPGIQSYELNAYASAGIHTDHECSEPQEVLDKIARGMYALLREGSACRDLRKLLKAVTTENSRRCLLCTDDCQPKTIREIGHLENHLRICVEEGLSPITAIQMASLNAAECYGLKDRGSISPGKQADFVIFDNLQNFNPLKVYIAGKLVAEKGQFLSAIHRQEISAVEDTMHLKYFSKNDLRLTLQSESVYAIGILSGGVVTKKEKTLIKRNQQNEFLYEPQNDVVKMAVIERHHNTGNHAVALLKGYGLKCGAIALSIAHDSHNIITVGADDDDMVLAVQKLVEQKGGIVLVKDKEVIETMPLPVAGLMSDQSGEWVDQKLTQIHQTAHHILGVNPDVEPIMTLCFMSLPVIPELKLTDSGLFDVKQFQFIPLEAE